ncbi:S8 family peptidase [Pedobacter glucosidilyticus]|uniref:S8 family peptidase n=1 Tax=Pedobacter glucosidilyticus TaxID=1122941 RepID=UPI0003F802F0|nr:S8 family serine peptidase [Pedobacter glucosidilyticus]
MKTLLPFLKLIVLISFFSICTVKSGNAQQRNLKHELLVFIVPDSLEISDDKTDKISHHEAKILSKSLKSALDDVKPVAIGKAFPKWNKADSVKTREDGIKVKTPPFDRVFTLTFKSEEEANAAIEILKKNPSVLFAEKNSEPKLHSDPDYLSGVQWHLNNDGRNGGTIGADIKAQQAWNIFTGSTAVTIAIFDSGLELSHDEMVGKATGDAHLAGTPNGYHGTHVAGIAAGNANNGKVGRGVDWNARLLSKRIFEPFGYIGDANVAQKITDAVNSGAQIANHSWGGPIYSTTLAMAFAYAYKMNHTSVVAMGNNNGGVIQYPAGINNVIAVGATQNNDQHSPFSNTGNHIDVAAPGGITNSGTDNRDIWSSKLNNSYGFHAGTSQAAPQVAGIASLLKGYNANLANDDIENIIKLSADKVAGMNNQNFTTTYGYGRVNAGQALSLLQLPNSINHFTATGGTVASTTGFMSKAFYATPGLAPNNYIVKRYEVIKSVNLPYSFCNIVAAWGRGVGSVGYNGFSNPNFGEGFCEVIPGSVTGTTATLRTYVYEVFNTIGQRIGYYPTTPANVTFAYTVLGQVNNFTITGPVQSCPNETYSIPNLPSGYTVTWSAFGSIGISGSNTANPVSTTSLYNGSGVLTATITTTCGQTITTTKNFTPITIDGSEVVCNTQRYTISGVPAGATVTWNVLPVNNSPVYEGYPAGNATITSNNNTYADISAISEGAIKLQATVNLGCFTRTITKDLMVGLPPWNDSTLVVSHYGSLSGYNFQVNIHRYPGTLSCEWYIDGIPMQPLAFCTGAYLNAYYGTYPYDYFQYNYYGNHTITAIAYTSCGNVTLEHNFYIPYNRSSFIISPNPAGEELTVSTSDYKAESNLLPESKAIVEKLKVKGKLLPKSFPVKLMNDKGEILRSGNLVDGKISFNTKFIPDGTYFLHIFAEKDVIKKQVLIRH